MEMHSDTAVQMRESHSSTDKQVHWRSYWKQGSWYLRCLFTCFSHIMLICSLRWV